MEPSKNISSFENKYADGTRLIRHIFVRDYETRGYIGVWEHEKGARQPVRINVDLSVAEESEHHGDNLANVVCYNEVVQRIDDIISSGHISLVETLAEKIAEMELVEPRVLSVRVRVEKLAAVKGAASVGVEIERHQCR